MSILALADKDAIHSVSSFFRMEKHLEPHSNGSNLSEMILGGQDGLVNVLGIVLGLTAAGADIRVILAGGMAATFAESVSMGAVAYTSTLAKADYYEKERQREIWEMEHKPDIERQEIYDIYYAKGFRGELLEQVVNHIISDKEQWLAIMMTEELHLEPVERKTALRSAVIVFISALIGSLIPVAPYFFMQSVNSSLIASLIISAVALFAFGAYAAKITVGWWVKAGFQLMAIGMISAIAGYLIGGVFGVQA